MRTHDALLSYRYPALSASYTLDGSGNLSTWSHATIPRPTAFDLVKIDADMDSVDRNSAADTLLLIPSGSLVGRSTAGTGPAQAIPCGSGVDCTGGAITATGAGGGLNQTQVDARVAAGITGKADSIHSHAGDSWLISALAAKQAAGSYAAASHSHAPSEITGTAVITNDARLSDARTPTAHGHVISALSGTLSSGQFPALTGAITTAAGSLVTALAAGAVGDANLVSTTAATSATAGTITVNMTTDIITITPTGACTFNASGGRMGREITFVITTSGTTTFILTFGTNFKTTATLVTGILTAKTFAMTFICTNGTLWVEKSRTIAM